jgi:hypothetical protein
MKKPLQTSLWALAAIFALLLQPKITVFGVPLNLTVALVYVYAARALATQSGGAGFTDITAETRAVSFGAVIGLIEDMMSGLLPGINFMSKALLGLLSVTIFRDYISQWTPFIGAAVIFIVTILDGVIVVMMCQFVMGIAINEYAAMQMILTQSVINLPLGCLIRCGHNISDIRGQ